MIGFYVSCHNTVPGNSSPNHFIIVSNYKLFKSVNSLNNSRCEWEASYNIYGQHGIWNCLNKESHCIKHKWVTFLLRSKRPYVWWQLFDICLSKHIRISVVPNLNFLSITFQNRLILNCQIVVGYRTADLGKFKPNFDVFI